VAAQARAGLAEQYASKTSAKITSALEFEAIKEREGLHVVGVAGFSGQWAPGKLEADPGLKAKADAATVALREHLLKLKEQYGDKLVVSSGATMEGVPKIIYDICAVEGIPAMGVACEKAFDYPLGTMKYLVIEGQNWGDESPSFLRTSDELVLLGGGGQAKREAIAASQQGKTISVFQGYGGSADQLTSADVPTASFVSAIQ
jgi:hypothetical protein